jgi:hypothetical protein
MKKVLLTLTLVGFAASVLAQGTITYLNNGSGFKAPVYGPEVGNTALRKTGNTTAGIPTGTQVYTGALLAGSGFVAQYWAAQGNNMAESALIGATTLNTFRTGTAAGFLAVTTATFQGIADAYASGGTVQLRAWDNSSGQYNTWDAARIAWNQGLIAAGMSELFNIPSFGGQTVTAPNPVGITSFNIYFIPEPTTFALAGLGAAALMIFRRRK